MVVWWWSRGRKKGNMNGQALNSNTQTFMLDPAQRGFGPNFFKIQVTTPQNPESKSLNPKS